MRAVLFSNGMTTDEPLSSYPFVVVRIRCGLCNRAGQYFWRDLRRVTQHSCIPVKTLGYARVDLINVIQRHGPRKPNLRLPIFIMHRANIVRVIKGTKGKISKGKISKAPTRPSTSDLDRPPPYAFHAP